MSDIPVSDTSATPPGAPEGAEPDAAAAGATTVAEPTPEAQVTPEAAVTPAKA